MRNSMWIVDCSGHVVLCVTAGELRWLLDLPDKEALRDFRFIEVRAKSRFGQVEMVPRRIEDIERGLGTAGTQSRRRPESLASTLFGREAAS